MPIWVIYDHPRDFPDKWVVRRQWVEQGVIHFDKQAFLVDTLEEARECIPPGLVRFLRSPDDDPVIVESWL